MKIENIPQFIEAHLHEELIVEFLDGDKYPARSLDLVGQFEGGEFEIRVGFEDCLNKSHARARAAQAGFTRSPLGCWWSSDVPREPVGMTYTLQQIKTIHNADAGFNYYERDN
jgi:hypothetical protein